MTTFDETTYCPKCNEKGTIVREEPHRGGKIFNINCQNDKCMWFDTGWVVQTKSDGTIAERQAGPKQFEPLSAHQEAAAKALIAEVKDGA